MKYNTKAEKIEMMYEGDASYKSPHMLDDDIISADSVEELYEKMALYQEEFLAKVHVSNPVTYGDYRVDFSEIYMVVEEFDKSKLEATKTYIERTALYDAAFEAEKQRAIKLKAAKDAAAKRDQDARDREEYLRLKKKFELAAAQ